MQWDKMFEKIYDENDTAKNIAIFIGGIFSLSIYLVKSDIILSIFSFLIFFSIVKELSKYFLTKASIKQTKKKLLENLEKDFSKDEKEVINYFIEKGSCFIPTKAQETLNSYGLDSLVSREVVQFIDNGGMGLGPSGFYLNEGIYKQFLQQKHYSKELY